MLFIKAYQISDSLAEFKENLARFFNPEWYRFTWRIQQKIWNLRTRGVPIKTLFRRWSSNTFFTISGDVLDVDAMPTETEGKTNLTALVEMAVLR
ncbi:MAG: hypothetical protein M0R80_28760 [Proteobacteria bacterium]|nr:hypothetical protein [Pseudomonadota bacterium]